MKNLNSGKHLTHEERKIIEAGIRNGATKTAIGKTIGKEKSTVGKEIKLHRNIKFRSSLPRQCANYAHCEHKRRCTADCKEFVEFSCTRRDRSPGACNGCSNYSHCRFDKYYYNADEAQREYESTLSDSREGVNLTTDEAKAIGAVVKPLLQKGQSPYHIIEAHPELNICEKTLYNYINNDVFHFSNDLTMFDLRRKLSRRPSKKHINKEAVLKKRQDRKYLQGRTYKDYLVFMEANPNANVLQMDTVYNDESTGPFIQTFKFIKLNVLFAIFHTEKTADSMVHGIDILEEVIGPELFEKYASVILTDRGSEFSAADDIEMRPDGTKRARIFYCDAMASCQKGSIENNHELLRYICPKGTDLYALGLTSQEKLNLALSHINSHASEKLEGKSPLAFTAFLSDALFQKLNAFGIKLISEDSVILKPYLLKNQK